MDKIDYEALARSRYTNQFEKDKVFDAIVQTLIEYKMKTQDLYINFAKTILDIELSTGRNLDLIGSIVGQPRVLVDFSTDKYFGFLGNPRAEPFDVGLWYSEFSTKGTDSRVLSDEEYRRIIKARIIRNKTNCNREDFIKILDLILDIDRTKPVTDDSPRYTLSSTSHGNIDLNVYNYDGDLGIYFLSNFEKTGDLIPVPMGYKLSVAIS